MTPDDEFKKAILDEKEYFNQFEDFETFLSENFLTVFFDDEGYLIRLSEIDSFEEYVRMSNQIIYTRGIAILNYLQSRYTNNNNLSVQQFNDEPQLSSKPTSEELAYEALKIAEEEVDKIFKLDEHFNQKNSNLSQLKLEFTKKKYMVVLLFYCLSSF